MSERNFGMIISNQLLHSLEEVCRKGWAWYGAWMQSSGKSNTRKKRSVLFTQRMRIIISFETR